MDITEAVDNARTEQKERESEQAQANDEGLQQLFDLIGKKFDDIKFDRREQGIVQLAGAVLLELVGNLGSRPFLEDLLQSDVADRTLQKQLVDMAFDTADEFYLAVDNRRKAMGTPAEPE